MGHLPHLYLPGPYATPDLRVTRDQVDHLSRVLRVKEPAQVSYTDGLGLVGDGMFAGGQVRRRAERMVERPSRLVVAVAPPASRDRLRFLVEKLAEVGVERLVWLETQHGAAKVPRAEKQAAWAVSALEQSRGAWLMETSPELAGWDQLEPPLVVCARDGDSRVGSVRTVAIGPEGGWAEGEIPEAPRLGLGPTVLRVETAAVAAATLLIRTLATGNSAG